ncbi:MAG: acetyltransferase [Crocinitomicaceae bacterium]|nr:acetyltransferase [Crocinitomicaceae bacterium]
MKRAFIFGNGGHANVLASILKNKNQEIFFIDKSRTTADVINEDEFFNEIESYKNHEVFLGIGSNKIRTSIYQKLINAGITPSNCISKHSFIAHDAKLGNGVVICPGSVVGSKAIIGNNTIINTMSSVDHDCVLGDNSQITCGVTFGGNVIVGKNCFFGLKSAVIPGINIGDNAIVMAGSIVVNDVPQKVMVGGNPAQIIERKNN